VQGGPVCGRVSNDEDSALRRLVVVVQSSGLLMRVVISTLLETPAHGESFRN
jgi:hypothetical protein